LTYNAIIGNPPFGDISKHRLENLGQFKLRSRRIECLFLELFVRNAKRRVVMIVPDGILSCTRDRPHRKWILDNFGYRATISLPRKVFWKRSTPGTTTTKTSIMVIDKVKLEGNYKIFMAIVEKVEDIDKILQHWRKFDNPPFLFLGCLLGQGTSRTCKYY